MFWSVLFFVYGSLSWALAMPEIDLGADTTNVTLGQPVELKLKIKYPLTFNLLEPDLRLIWPGIEFSLTDLTGPTKLQNNYQIVLRGSVQFFELGRNIVPPVKFLFLNSKNDTVLVASQDLTVFVNSILSQDEQEIRDIKPPIKIDGGIPIWLFILLVVMVFICIGGVLFFLFNRYCRRASEDLVEDVQIDFSAEFKRIEQMGLLEKGEIKLYYSLLSDNLRKFLEKMWVEEAMEKTTGEIESVLQAQNIDKDLISRTGLYLSTADLVKFARFCPDRNNANYASQLGLSILNSFEKLNKQQIESTETTKRIGDAESTI